SHLAYNAMLIASVTTVIFNANPLLRYDGYYMLSDFLEIPNLQQKSREYVLGIIKRHVFRIKSTQPLPPMGQRIQLFFYGIASSVYRVFVGILIILTVTYSIPVLGPLMAISGVITWLVVPIAKLSKYLTIEPELHRKRGRAFAFTGAVVALLFLLIGVIPFDVKVNAEGIVHPKEKSVLFSKTAGFVKDIKSHDGQRLKKGDTILVCRSDELDANIDRLKNMVAAAEIRLRQSSMKDPSQAKVDELQLQTVREDLQTNLKKQADLTVHAPIDGYLVAPDIDHIEGKFMPEGTEICTVQETETLELRGTIEQGDAELMFRPTSQPTAAVKL